VVLAMVRLSSKQFPVALRHLLVVCTLTPLKINFVSILKSAGIVEVKCKKLVAKGVRVFGTATFMVSCSIICADIFYI